jgi:uncharacterized protein YdeI (YjbR/CyaY-like superfamily)
MAPFKVDFDHVHEFKTAAAFERWLKANHARESEVWIKLHKGKSGLPSITAKEAIDVALCWGWIDGIRKSFDDRSFLQRYSPRGGKSVWSQINRDNVERLIREGRMQPTGLAQVEAAKADGRWDKAYRVSGEPPEDLLAAIEAEPEAMEMYLTLNAQNRFALTFRTLGMKTEAGRRKKIAGFVEMLKRGETIYPQKARTK